MLLKDQVLPSERRMQKENNTGPRTKPCRAPQVMEVGSIDYGLFVCMRNCKEAKYRLKPLGRSTHSSQCL